MESSVLPVGSLIYVTSYGPNFGLKGTVQEVEVIIQASVRESQYFYLVTLHEGQLREPLWLTQDDIATVEGDSLSTASKA